ncbi:MAG TPA: hypothetical protein VF257_10175, partial [Solirubrobacteraceae bacterium]
AALAGGRVLATDWSAEAIDFTRRNAEANGAQVETAVADWADPGALLERGPWDLVLASDVLYEARNVAQLLVLLEDAGDHAVIADPGRPTSIEFEASVTGSWWLRTETDPGPPRISLYDLRRRV